jgi:hypothetical protein
VQRGEVADSPSFAFIGLCCPREKAFFFLSRRDLNDHVAIQVWGSLTAA